MVNPDLLYCKNMLPTMQDAQADLKAVMSKSNKKKPKVEKEDEQTKKDRTKKKKIPHPRVPSPPPSSNASNEGEEEEEPLMDSSDLDADVFAKGFDRSKKGNDAGQDKKMSNKMKMLCRDMSDELIGLLPQDMSAFLACTIAVHAKVLLELMQIWCVMLQIQRSDLEHFATLLRAEEVTTVENAQDCWDKEEGVSGTLGLVGFLASREDRSFGSLSKGDILLRKAGAP